MGDGVQKHPRYRIQVPIGVVSPSGDVEEFTVVDISLGGVFVKTLLPAPPGSFVRLRLPVGAGQELSLMGRVVHIIDDVAARHTAHAKGMGVQFDGLSPDTQRRLETFVNGFVDGVGPPPVIVGDLIEEVVSQEVQSLMSEADFLSRAGQPAEAKRALLYAQGIKPDSSGVHRRLASLDQRACELLDDAEHLRREQQVERARNAARVSDSRAVLLRAMRMLAGAGAHEDMLEVAQRLVDLDAGDELPLFALLQVNERLQRWAAAAHAGELLLRLRPDDLGLQDRVARLERLARLTAPIGN